MRARACAFLCVRVRVLACVRVGGRTWPAPARAGRATPAATRQCTRPRYHYMHFRVVVYSAEPAHAPARYVILASSLRVDARAHAHQPAPQARAQTVHCARARAIAGRRGRGEMEMSANACVCACVRACVRACVLARLCFGVCARARACACV